MKAKDTETGELLRQIESRTRDGIFNLSRHDGQWYASVSNGSWPDTDYPFTWADTFQECLRGLLRLMPVPA